MQQAGVHVVLRPLFALECLEDRGVALLGHVCQDRHSDVFDAFDLRCVYDKLDGRVEISATITESVADLLQEPGDLALCGCLLRGWDSNPQPIG